MSDEIPRRSYFEGESVWLLAHIKTADGTDLVQADMTGTNTSIDVDVYRVSTATPKTLWQTANVSFTTSVFDTLKTDAYWSKDSTGYNFRYLLTFNATDSAGVDDSTDTSVPEGGELVRIELEIVTDSFGSIYRVFLADILSLQQS